MVARCGRGLLVDTNKRGGQVTRLQPESGAQRPPSCGEPPAPDGHDTLLMLSRRSALDFERVLGVWKVHGDRSSPDSAPAHPHGAPQQSKGAIRPRAVVAFRSAAQVGDVFVERGDRDDGQQKIQAARA